MKPTTISILVPAAGRGARAKVEGNKVLQSLHGKPLLWWTLRALTAAGTMPEGASLLEVILAVRQEEESDVLASAAPLAVTALRGGATRQESVAACVAAASGDYLLVHDAARPLVQPLRVAAVITAAIRDGAAILAVPASDTIKQATASATIAATCDRRNYWLAQTPQVFRRDILSRALAMAIADGFDGTDCASLVERLRDDAGNFVHPITLIDGGRFNLKITYPEDFQWAQAWLAGPGACD